MNDFFRLASNIRRKKLSVMYDSTTGELGMQDTGEVLNEAKSLLSNFPEISDKIVGNVEKFTNTEKSLDALERAASLAKSYGYWVGYKKENNPIGLAKDVTYIPPWNKMQDYEYDTLGGVILSSDFHNNDVYLVEFSNSHG